MADPYIGEIRMVGFTFAPEGWANADGQMLTVAAVSYTHLRAHET